MWKQIESNIEKGIFPAIFINAAGEICLDGVSNGAVLPKRLAAKFPAEVVAAAQGKKIERQAAQAEASVNYANELKRKEAEKAAAIAPWRNKRVWGITGDFVEEMTGPRYTLDEIEAWHNWHGIQQFRAKSGSLAAVCYGDEESVEKIIATIDLYRFFDLAGHRSFSFSAVVKTLESSVAESRERKAKSN